MYQRGRGESHQAAVACRVRVRITQRRRPSQLELSERRPCLDADVEASARAREMPVAPPIDEPIQLVACVELTAFDKALGEAERHARVVRPLPGPQPERAAS